MRRMQSLQASGSREIIFLHKNFKHLDLTLPMYIRLVVAIIILSVRPCYAQITTLTLEGCGVRAFAYVGALQALQERQLLNNVNCIYGTSGGAIIAALYSAGYTPDELITQMAAFNMKMVSGSKWQQVKNALSYNKRLGLFNAHNFELWLNQKLFEKTQIKDITMEQLYHTTNIDIHIIAVDIAHAQLLDINYKSFPKLPVATAVLASMSIPAIVQPVMLDTSNTRTTNKKLANKVLCDGGILYNNPYPIAIQNLGTDKAKNIIALTIDPKSKVVIPKSKQQLIKQLYVTTTDVRPQLIAMPNHISINDGGISPRIKRLSQERLDALVKQGHLAAEQLKMDE
jgi:predicted acylesterase/phospholipase RssA